MKHIAIIDLGTNTFHLLIADLSMTGMEILCIEKKSVKIGEGGITKGVISPDAQNRALQALDQFVGIMDSYQVNYSYASATSAFRNASNGQELAARIKDQTGIEVEIISGQQEANYIYEGVKQAIDLGHQKSLIMDIGGGSVEFIIANQQQTFWLQSFEIGAQRLMDHFQQYDPITSGEIKLLEAYLDEKLVPLATAMEEHNPRVLVGSSGTFDTLSEIFCLKAGIVKKNQPEQPLSVDGFKAIHAEILQKTREQRLRIPGMIEMRVDMIVVATSLINYVLKRFTLGRMRVSSYALKEGVLNETIRRIREDLS